MTSSHNAQPRRKKGLLVKQIIQSHSAPPAKRRVLNGLYVLPVELLYEILLFSRSSLLPCASRHLRNVFNSSPDSLKAQYILEVTVDGFHDRPSWIISAWLRYRICNLSVFKILERIYKPMPQRFLQKPRLLQLPKRLFRHLKAPNSSQYEHNAIHRDHTDTDPYPFVQYLFSQRLIICQEVQLSTKNPILPGKLEQPEAPILPQTLNAPLADPNSYDGYPLISATFASQIHLMQLLLSYGANPSCRGGLAVKIAAAKGDLSLVKLLVDGDSWTTVITQEMLREAVRADAKDVIEYFVKEKGCIPDMTTLQVMTKGRRPTYMTSKQATWKRTLG